MAVLTLLVAPATTITADAASTTQASVQHRGAHADRDRLAGPAERTEPRDDALPTMAEEEAHGRALQRTSGRARIMFVRAYWGRKAPAKPTAAQVKTAAAENAAFFRETSYGAYTWRKPTVPGWLKISKPGYCEDFYGIARQVQTKLTAHGLKPGRYRHVIIYVPCSNYYAGQGTMPGGHVVLYGNLDLRVIAHEALHNLGLDHANYSVCRRGGHRTTFPGGCRTYEYGDWQDVMGMGTTLNLSPPSRHRLGWERGLRTMKRSGTATLAPLGSSVSGTRTLRVPSGKEDVWVDYRNGTGYDSMNGETAEGVFVHLAGPGRGTRLLDATPLSNGGDTLPVDSSITTSSGTRIAVLSEDGSTARVEVTYGAGRAKRPAAPKVTATGGPGRVEVSWTHPNDHGAPIGGYLVKASDGTTKKVNSPGGVERKTVFRDLDPGEYTFSVTATNEVGRSDAGKDRATATRRGATGTFWSPEEDEEVYGLVDIGVGTEPDPDDPEPVTSVEVFLDGTSLGLATENFTDYWELSWDTKTTTEGEHELTAVVTDEAGTATTTDPVSVEVVHPTLTITSPQSGAVVDQELELTWTGTHLDVIGWVDVSIDGSLIGSEFAEDEGVTIDTSWWDPGPVVVELSSTWDRFSPVQLPITISHAG